MSYLTKICIGLAAASLVIFYAAFYYYMSLLGQETAWAEALSIIASIGGDGPVYTEPTMVPGDGGFTEERAVFAVFVLAGILSLAAVVLASYKRLKTGHYRLFLPLFFGVGAIFMGIVYTGYVYGIHEYA
ncbi:MAG: hypothetical protein CMI02_11855 [Oceanospirillaceae bacterium]|nr:hypothetical protein [Oceanospirillaceae bacterium]MBT12713.1 hypothetical protein [Oceanospirillaceae bacterium]|tara:strand:- start:109571 stop:109960 length:390 start_codon:yes stop_codon:yes gene_type:complete